MKNIFILILFCLSALSYAATDTALDIQINDQVIHIQKVYKTIDTFKLKVDIFYTDQTFQKVNNTAIVFFHGGGWAYGTPSKKISPIKSVDEILKVADDFLRKYKFLD